MIYFFIIYYWITSGFICFFISNDDYNTFLSMCLLFVFGGFIFPARIIASLLMKGKL